MSERYTIAPPGEEPPASAVWRSVLDHRTPDGELAAAWVAPGLPRHGLGAHHIPEGAKLYLVPGSLSCLRPDPPWPGPEAPQPGECYGHWRRRSPGLLSGFDQA